MPGRGQPWKVGGTPDNTITSDDIKQGTIKQEDIDPAYQAIIEGGGGIDREQVSNPFTDFYLYDEFFYPAPSTYLDVHYEKTGTFTAPTNVIGGQVQFSTPASPDGIARINTCGAGLLAVDAGNNFRLVVRARKGSSDADSAHLIGLYTDSGSKPDGSFPWSTKNQPYLFFESDGTGNWFALVHNGSTPQSTDTGVSSSTAFKTFEIRSNPSTPNIEFLIDDVVVATFTTSLPTGNMAYFTGVQTGISTAKTLIIDSLFMYQDR